MGFNPTFDDLEKVVEVHVLHNFVEPFYGADIEVSLEHFIRAETDCASLGELIDIMNLDVTLVRMQKDGVPGVVFSELKI